MLRGEIKHLYVLLQDMTDSIRFQYRQSFVVSSFAASAASAALDPSGWVGKPVDHFVAFLDLIIGRSIMVNFDLFGDLDNHFGRCLDSMRDPGKWSSKSRDLNGLKAFTFASVDGKTILHTTGQTEKHLQQKEVAPLGISRNDRLFV